MKPVAVRASEARSGMAMSRATPLNSIVLLWGIAITRHAGLVRGGDTHAP